MPEFYAAKEARVQKTLEAISKERKPNITRLALKFYILYQQLLNRYNRISFKQSYNFALISSKEKTIYQYL